MSTTEEKIREILSVQLDIDEDKITPNTLITDDLGADSLDVVELMMSIEEEFGITIDEEEIQNFKTVRDVGKFIDDNI